jgi:L-alanine-DL-glutamate epimerase-like enolase superfamily enzyme
MKPSVNVAVESWPIAGAFTIARGSKREAQVVVVTLTEGGVVGRGECVPYGRYGETIEGVVAAIRKAGEIEDRQQAQTRLPAGAARNAIDCALWDLEAKISGIPAAVTTGAGAFRPITTCYTLSLAPAEQMAAQAQQMAHLPLLKLKLGGGAEDAKRMRQVRAARPDARLVADANEAWDVADFVALMEVAAECGMESIEQPLAAGEDVALASLPRTVPVCADESAHTSTDIAEIAQRYDAVNIKLDKAGGLTEALGMRAEARRHGLKVMVGSMVATSLSMAPALLLAQGADWVDLDSPLLLARDRVPGLTIVDGIIQSPPSGLWGQ